MSTVDFIQFNFLVYVFSLLVIFYEHVNKIFWKYLMTINYRSMSCLNFFNSSYFPIKTYICPQKCFLSLNFIIMRGIAYKVNLKNQFLMVDLRHVLRSSKIIFVIN